MINKILSNFFNNIKYTGKFQLHLQNIKKEENNIKNINPAILCKEINTLKKNVKKTGLQKEDKYKIFSIIKKAAKETLNIIIYDVQLYAGWILTENNIIEMRTGEGKTIVAVFPAIINYITEKKTHIATTNDYLAKRDTKWMQPLYNMLGITVTYITNKMNIKKKKKAYLLDIVYSTCSEFVFDYLKNNTTLNRKYYVKNTFDSIIIDEVDSILIDDARTPLIIANYTTTLFQKKIEKENLFHNINLLAKNFIKLNNKIKLFTVNKKKKEINLTDIGYKKVEFICKKNNLITNKNSLYEKKNNHILNMILNALKANILFRKNIDYIKKNNKIFIVDENTGRLLNDRRWTEGLHQAIEAKENLSILPTTEPNATITFQSYIKLYKKVCGMTGTAKTEKIEFQKTYNLNVIQIPPNKKCRRYTYNDLIYLTKIEKFKRIFLDTKYWYEKKRPILLGTTNILISTYISTMLNKILIKNNLLNANYSIKEANIIATAGTYSAITVATNIAGRGTDILLGGSITFHLTKFSSTFNNKNILFIINQIYLKVKNEGGLYIIGSERYNLRRIDNQLEGRCARQGDPGSIQFYLSLEDNLLKLFLHKINIDFLKNLELQYTQAISHKAINILIKKAQKDYEVYNYITRKYLTEFDNILNLQRIIVYKNRKKILFKYKKAKTNYYKIQNNKKLILHIINEYWKKHLLDLEYLKKTINTQCFIGKKPLDYYKEESYKLFLILLKKIKISCKYLLT